MGTIDFRKLFREVKDRKSLKSLYRKLCFENHPDRGGDVENMKVIKSVIKELAKEQNPDIDIEKIFGD